MKIKIFLMILSLTLINCGPSEGNSVQDTENITSKSSTTTAIISDTPSTDNENKNKFENINSKFIFDKDSFPSREWSQSFELIELDKGCINNSTFNPNSNFSVDTKINFEKIFLKSFDEIMRDDIFDIQKLTIDENIQSYEGLGYLTCLQYLDAGQGFKFWGRDYRFLSNLTELRYLNCKFCSHLRAEHLYPLDKLEYLITPAGFKNTSMLHKLSNLKYKSLPIIKLISPYISKNSVFIISLLLNLKLT